MSYQEPHSVAGQERRRIFKLQREDAEYIIQASMKTEEASSEDLIRHIIDLNFHEIEEHCNKSYRMSNW